jgi:hypothetical protein
MKNALFVLAVCLVPAAALADPPRADLRDRIERRMAHARQRVDRLAARGRIGQDMVARFNALETRARQTVNRVFADGQVTQAERQELRALRRDARELRRAIRAHVGQRHPGRPGGALRGPRAA